MEPKLKENKEIKLKKIKGTMPKCGFGKTYPIGVYKDKVKEFKIKVEHNIIFDSNAKDNSFTAFINDLNLLRIELPKKVVYYAFDKKQNKKVAKELNCKCENYSGVGFSLEMRLSNDKKGV